MAPPSPLPTVRTADDLLELPDDGFRYELVRGELRRTMPAGPRHGVLAMRVVRSLDRVVQAADLGEIYIADTGFRLAKDHVRAPDVSFVRRERVAKTSMMQSFWPGAPDLGIEVVSPSDRWARVEEKALDLIDAGTLMVVVVNDANRTVTVFRSRTDVVVLTEDNVLDGGDVVPGWNLPLAEIFA